MSKIISVGLKLGATLDNAFSSVFSNAKSTVNQLGRTTDLLSQRQQRLGQIMNRALAQPTRNVQVLRNHYERLGQSVDRLKTKQNNLNIALAKQQSLSEQRKNLNGDMVGSATAAWGNARLLRESVGSAVNFQDGLRDSRIKGQLSTSDEALLGKVVRDAVKNTNQDHTSLSAGLGQLIEGETSMAEVQAYVPLLGKSVTGLRVSMDEGAATFLALRDMGVTGEKEMSQALDQLIWSGQQGGYGMANMFNAIGELGDDIKKHKLGLDSLGDIAATLQIGDGMMGADNAMSGLKGWLGEMNTDKRASAFASAYKTINPNQTFDYHASMQKAVADGYSEFEASMKIASGFLEDRMGKAGIAEMNKYQGNAEKQRELMEKFGLSEIFKDSNQVNMVLGYRQNKAEFDRIKEGGRSNGASTGSLQQTADLRLASPTEKFKSFGNTMKELSITVGEALLPPVLQLVDTLIPIIGSLTQWIAANPKLVAGLVGAATAVVGLKVASVGAAWGMNFFVKSPMAALNVILNKNGASLELFRAKMLMGSATGSKFGTIFSKVGTAIATVGKTFASVGRMMLLSPIGLVIGAIAGAALLIYKYWQPISAFFSGIFDGISESLAPIGVAFNEVFGGLGDILQPVIGWLSSAWDWLSKLFEPFQATAEQLEGAKNAGRSFGQVLGKAISFILTPVKLLFKGIAWLSEKLKSAFDWSPLETIKNVWGGVTGFFSNLWNDVTGSIGGGIKNAMSFVENWSPLDSIKNAWQGVTGWFGDIWNTLTGSVDLGLIDINAIIEIWSPIELFKKSFNGILSWFGVELPGSFTEAGKAVLDGLIGGITSKLADVKESITNVGSSISSWFKEKLGINSPSKVFIGFGENVSEGAAIGINNQSSLVNKAALGLATATAITLSSPAIAAPELLNKHVSSIKSPDTEAIRRQQFNSSSSGMTITFTPTINVKGGDDVKSQVNQALKMSFNEFERLMKEYDRRTNRTAYKGINS